VRNEGLAARGFVRLEHVKMVCVQGHARSALKNIV
jgi:hypothetical protein